MICPHIYRVCSRVTWSGRFKLLSETCHCGHIRERTIRCNEPVNPSKIWIRA